MELPATALDVVVVRGPFSCAGYERPGSPTTVHWRVGDGAWPPVPADATRAVVWLREGDALTCAGCASLLAHGVSGAVRVRSSGAVALSDCCGSVVVETTTGSVGVRRHVGALRVTSTAGGVFVENHRGDVRIRTTSGDVELRHLSGRCGVRTLSGDVTAKRGVVASVASGTGRFLR